MIIVEYRLPLPITLDEYNRALRYVVARVAESTTGVKPGEGIEILKNERFLPGEVHGMPDGGVYTEKVLRFRSRVPALLRRFMPASATEIHESSWLSDAKGSKCKTVYRNPFLGDRFYLSIESNHLEGIDNEENAVGLDEEDLAKRQVFYLDIAGDMPRKLPTEDPSTFVSEKSGRGRLQPGWWMRGEEDGNGSSEEETRLDREILGSIQSEKAAAKLASSSATSSSAQLQVNDDQDKYEENDEEDCETKSGNDDLQRGMADSDETQSGSEMTSCETKEDMPHLSPKSLSMKQSMCCYKVVKMEFTGFGLRRFVQRWASRGLIPNGFIDIHRKLFCWMDDWWDMTIEDIEEMEQQTAQCVNALFNDPEKMEAANLANAHLADKDADLDEVIL